MPMILVKRVNIAYRRVKSSVFTAYEKGIKGELNKRGTKSKMKTNNKWKLRLRS